MTKQNTMKKLKLTSKFPCGKYKDTAFTIGFYCQKDPDYVLFFVSKIKDMIISDNILETAMFYKKRQTL
jgi:hypothetical protein